MIKRRSIKKAIIQIVSITEKDLFLFLRFKANFIIRYLDPIIQLVIFLFLFGAIFNIQEYYTLGYWNSENYILFLLIAFCIQFSRSIIDKYRQLFINEKYWKTLSGIMVAPINRITLLSGVLISELIMISVPFLFILILAYILYPVKLVYLLLVLLIFLSIFILFSSIGLIIGAFSISNEELVPYSTLVIRIIFIFSCINFPKEIFPEFIQIIILYNPFYYIFDLLRIVWYSGLVSEASLLLRPFHIVMIFFCVITPIISIKIFNKVYKRYGITGY